MSLLNRHRDLIIEAVFLIILFFVSQLPLRDFDLWFHIKSGELFVSQGHLQRTEVFSYSAFGREWTTFEWLFQVVIYWVSRIGLWAIPPFTSIFVTVGLAFLLALLRFLLGVPLIARLVLTFAFWVSTYEFNTARPHTVAYMFLIIHLFLILGRMLKNKRWIWISPLLTLVWSNIHSTGFLAWGFLLAFGMTSICQYWASRDQHYMKLARELLVLAVLNAIVTLLPPMGIADYQLLWRFFREREFLGNFIAEWGSPQDNPFGFWVYTGSTVVAVAALIASMVKTKRFTQGLIAVPFLLMVAGGYTATRNVYLGTLGVIILLGYAAGQVLLHAKQLPRVALLGLFASVSLFYSWVYVLKLDSVHKNRLYYPIQATEFIKKANLKGNMFNDYNYGSYMLYRLYPTHQVFIDGRADVYECCEMRDYLKLAANKRMDDATYRKFLNTLWDAYDISYAVIVTTKHNVMRRIATLLNTDPSWVLVFWDDDSQIFVRKDGKNDSIIENFGVKAATPYLRNPYVSGKEEQAYAEYDRMDKVAKSARTSNALGFFLLKNGQFDEARARFLEAVDLDPTFESPYMNLAELEAKNGNIKQAISLYYKAQRLAFDRGLIYIRLGQLILEIGDKGKATQIWKDGIKFTIDEDAKKQLEKLLQTL